MTLDIDLKNVQNIQIIGDRVLIKPKTISNKTKTGLYLPPNVTEKEKAQSGYIIKVGPGYPIPSINEEKEPWMQKDNVQYIPLQVREGDLAVYLNNMAHEIIMNNEKYIIIPQSSILMVVRDEELFK